MSRDHFWRSISRDTSVEVSALSLARSKTRTMCDFYPANERVPQGLAGRTVKTSYQLRGELCSFIVEEPFTEFVLCSRTLLRGNAQQHCDKLRLSAMYLYILYHSQTISNIIRNLKIFCNRHKCYLVVCCII